MANRIIAITLGLRLMLRAVLVGGAVMFALVGLSGCTDPAQDSEPENAPETAPVPSPSVPKIDAGVPDNLETASFALG
jgi:hypothetical protein